MLSANPFVAIGCMRLSTAADRDEERALDLLHAALDAGVTLFDTANAYCLDRTDTGHNERLIARALATWSGDRSTVRVATKGGLTRPEGRWEADGHARALTAACESSLRALGVGSIDLYQLHAPDPRVPLATSVRALDALRRRGLIEGIGLCNVTVGQIEEARRLTNVDAVQNEVSLWHDDNLLSGVVDYCTANGISLLAYRPLGGPGHRRRIETDPVLGRLAADHGCTPFEIALAALADISPVIVPLPGPTRVETARSAANAAKLRLTDDDRTLLRERFAVCRAAAALRPPRVAVGARRDDAEVVLVMGLPAAGKSTAAERLTADGYARVNRDEKGGSLDALLPVLDTLLASGTNRVVLDNTYVARKSRAAVLAVAARHGVPVRCLWLSTSVEDAQVNAVMRMVAKYGRLLDPDEMRTTSRSDVSVFPPSVQFRYQRQLEPPQESEGFSRIDVVSFVRSPAGSDQPSPGVRRPAITLPTAEDLAATRLPDPARLDSRCRDLQTAATSRAVILWCDGVLQRSRAGHRTPMSPDDVEVIDGRGARLRRHVEEGSRVFGVTWLPEIAQGTMSHADAAALFARLRELLGIDIEIEYCPHGAGPPVCWCRKPLPGLGVVLRQRHRLDPSQCVYVGVGSQDPGFARRLGFAYRQAAEFF
jgi:aryl-alcohol dehydrogenase-like predicted oxidoreductase/histidinol phosphatase-like enzyme